MQYLFSAWDDLKKRIDGKGLFIFLDYDGTLVPIRQVPDLGASSLPEGTRDILLSLKAHGNRLAIISGRALQDLKKMVGIKDIIYSGNHGLELEGPKIKFENLVSLESRRLIRKIRHRLLDRLCGIRGVIIEDKGLTFSLHYRLVKDDDMPIVVNSFNFAVRQYVDHGEIRVSKGKKVFEVRPSVNWDKGKMVLWLLARYRFAAGDREIFPVYIGDDTTDEDGFRVLRKEGLTVFVGKPKESLAKYYLKDTEDVRRFLVLLTRLQEE